MRTPLVLSIVGLAILALPVVAPAYYVTLMLPFMAYGVVLLGLNLLFGYTGLVSFGHALFIAIGWLLARTAFGRIIRASADNREMAEALGVDMRWVYARVFTLGTMLGTLGGALVIPATAAMSEMGIELIVEAFAVVVIGGLGSMRGAFVGALVVGVLRSVAISVYPELGRASCRERV